MKITLICISQVTAYTGYSADEIPELTESMAFPLPVTLDNGYVGWLESEIEEWIKFEYCLKNNIRYSP